MADVKYICSECGEVIAAEDASMHRGIHDALDLGLA